MPDNTIENTTSQPPVEAYAPLISPVLPTMTPQPQQKPKKPNVFILLTLEVLGLLAVFIIFLLALNYFKVISLSGFIPNQPTNISQTTQTPAPAFDPKTNLWTAKGTLYQYNDEKLKVKIGSSKIIDLVYNTNSLGYLYKSQADIDNPSGVPPMLYTLFDIDQKTNLGTHIQVEYKIENGVNTITRIILYH